MERRSSAGNNRYVRLAVVALLIVLFALSLCGIIYSVLSISDGRGGWPLLLVSSVILIILVICYVGASFLYKLGLVPGTDRAQVFNAPHNAIKDDDGISAEAVDKEYKEALAAIREWLGSKPLEVVGITSGDGLKLHAYLLPCTASHKWVIDIHGYTGKATDTLEVVKEFHEEGFSVLYPDCRAHGESEGAAIGMGWPDRLDMLRWIDYIIERDKSAEIVLYGVSMGAATVMMTVGEKFPANVKAAIEDCGYTSVWDEFAYQLKALFYLPAFPVLYMASLITRVRAGYWFDEASALNQIRKCTIPVFFIHGTADTFVPFWMERVLYDAAKCEKQLLVVENAGHAGASRILGKEYWRKVFDFTSRYI